MTQYLAPVEIQNEIKIVFQTKNIPMEYFWKYVVFANQASDATPYIDVDKNGYHFVISERGYERERRTTQDIQELYYWLFDNITFDIASKVALYTKTTWEQRRVRFKVQLDWLRSINPDFEKRCLCRINDILYHQPPIDWYFHN